VSFSTPHAYQTQYGGGDSDAFAAKLDFSQPAASQVFSVVNAASLFPGNGSSFPTGAVAPGEIVTLFGNGFGSQPSVSFDDIPAPVLYASNCQINAVVPFEVNPGLATFVSVQGSAQDKETIGPIRLPVVAAVPGIFAVGGMGTGQAAVLNQDGTPNSSSNPAALGSTVSVYMTGTGRLTPPYPVPIQGIGATIGFVIAPVIFAGQAPGLIAGVTQVNVQIPQNAPTGDSVPITIYAGNYASQSAVVIAVR
ncbi:MAG: hypothetical protein M3Z85_22400, partial [Acidobacteriota bacterium]|nr:hypothetical protein [Acidobacteriota bacterium]